MKLTYYFDGTVSVLASPSEHIANGWYEPHYHNEYQEDVEYEFEVEPTLDDYIEYLMPDAPKNMMPLEKKGFAKGAATALSNVLDDYDELKEAIEEEDGFEEFMHDKYEEEAHDRFCEEATD